MTKDNKNREITDIKDIGEFGLIDKLTEGFVNTQESTLLGVGDDTAIIDSGDQMTLITKDLLVEGVHFDITYTPLKHLGYKSVVVNLSDIYSMNGTPSQIIVGLAISSRYTVEALSEFYEGIKLACKKYNVDLVGGDTCASQAGLFISVTAVGHAKKENITYRKGAKKNELVCVSGDLGAAYAGLLILKREKEVFKVNPNAQPDISSYSYVLERQLKPEAGAHIIKVLEELDIMPTSMIDISDGLASEIMHICTNSKTGASIFEEKLPMHPETIAVANEFEINPVTFALNGGEDYELLFTISQNDFEKIDIKSHIKVIGYITDESEGVNLITKAGQQVPLQAQGWDAFKSDK